MRFVVVGMARSGTTVTYQALQGHPNVRALMDEVRVSPFFTRGLEVFTTSGNNPYEREYGLDLLIDAMTLLPGQPGKPELMGYGGLAEVPKSPVVLANGVKTALAGAEEGRQFVEAMRTIQSLREIAILRVNRRDLVAQYASLARALQSGIWHSHSKASPPALERVDGPMTIDPNEFAQYCRDCHSVQRELDRLAETHRVLPIDYERDLDTPDRSVYQGIFEFLGLPPVEPIWMRSTKVAPPVETYVSNATELYAVAAEIEDAQRS